MWRWLGFTEDEAADETDSGGEREEEERVDDAVFEGLVGLEEKMRVFDRKEESVEDGVEGEQAEQKGNGFGEFEQHAQAPLVNGSLPRSGSGCAVETFRPDGY